MFNLFVSTGRSDADAMVEDAVLLQFEFEQAFLVRIVADRHLGELRAVIRLDFPYREGTATHRLDQELLGAVSAVLVIHLSVSPPYTLIHSCELVILPPIYQAFSGHEPHAHLHFLSRIFRPLIRLVFPRFTPLVPLCRFQLGDDALKPAVAARISVLLPQLLVGQYQAFPVMLLCKPTNLMYLLRCVRSRRAVRASAPLHQALPCPVIPLQPLVQRLSADLIPYYRICPVPMLQIILKNR